MIVMNPKDRVSEPGIGLGEDGWKVLTYADLVNARRPAILSECGS